jgi:hypothetical protein
LRDGKLAYLFDSVETTTWQELRPLIGGKLLETLWKRGFLTAQPALETET